MTLLFIDFEAKTQHFLHPEMIANLSVFLGSMALLFLDFEAETQHFLHTEMIANLSVFLG